MFRSLINYGRARVLDTSELTFYQNGDRVVCRNAKMSFSFRNGLRKSFVEDVVFTFDSKNASTTLLSVLAKRLNTTSSTTTNGTKPHERL